MREDKRRSQFPPYPLQEAEINLTKVKAVFKCSNESEKGSIVSFLVRLVLSKGQ